MMYLGMGSIRRKKFLAVFAVTAAVFVAQSVLSVRHDMGAAFASGHAHDHDATVHCAKSAVPHHHECCCDGRQGAASQRVLTVKRSQKRAHSDASLPVSGARFDPETPAADYAAPAAQAAPMTRSDSHFDRGPPA